jgi:hypothetical protein
MNGNNNNGNNSNRQSKRSFVKVVRRTKKTNDNTSPTSSTATTTPLTNPTIITTTISTTSSGTSNMAAKLSRLDSIIANNNHMTISKRVTHILMNDIALLSHYPLPLIDMIMSYYGNPGVGMFIFGSGLSSYLSPNKDECRVLPRWPIHNGVHGSPSEWYRRAVMINDLIYCMGGSDPWRCSAREMDIYNIKTNEWSTGEPMMHGRFGHIAVQMIGTFNDQRIMVIGDYETNTTCEIYDIKLNKWLTAPSTGTTRYYGSSTSFHDGKVYMFSGQAGRPTYETTSKCEVYSEDPITGSGGHWSSIADIPHPVERSTAVVVDDVILVLGGFSDNEGADIIQEYTPATNKWRVLPWKLPQPRCSFAAVYDPFTKTLMIAGVSSLHISPQLAIIVYSCLSRLCRR